MLNTASFPSRRSPRAVVGSIALGIAGVGLSVALGAQATAPAAPQSTVKTVKAAPGLYEIVTSPSTGLVYVASVGKRGEPGSAKILGLDPTTLEIKKTIAVGDTPAFGLGINDKTQKLYTTNTRNGNVSIIDLKTSTVLATVGVDTDPKAHVFRALVDEEKNVTYVSVTAGRIWVIDGKTDKLTGVIEDVGKTTVGLALDHKRNQLFAANIQSQDIAVIDLATRKVTSRIPVQGAGPTMLVFDEKSRRLFVTNQKTGDVAVLDTAAGTQLKAIKTGEGALGIGFSAAKNRVYVANRQAGTVTVIDAKTLEVVENVTAGTLPNTVAIDPKTHRVYVTNKAKGGPRDAAPVEDPSGDTVTLIEQ